MAKLGELRKEIDALDAAVVRLLAGRMRLSRQAGAAKRHAGKNVVDRNREKTVLGNAVSLASSLGVSKATAIRLFKEIIRESTRVQQEPRRIVAFQGEVGAYSEEAALQSVRGCATLPCRTFSETMKAVEDSEADLALIPVENSLEGGVGGAMDLLIETRLHAVGEVLHPVGHCLLALPGHSLGEIREVWSHPQALGQCRMFLEASLPNARQLPFYDTAGAAKAIAEQRREGAAAIAGRLAAAFHGLEITASDIGNSKNNFTRFLAFSKKRFTGPAEKTSLVFTLKNRPGALHSALAGFADAGVNLTRLESRPVKGGAWEYTFFADFEGDARKGKGRKAVTALEESGAKVKVLGSYRKAGGKNVVL
ncbi:MAG: prephenate dehydratase [Candidatus Micrarchaeota archaeon]